MTKEIASIIEAEANMYDAALHQPYVFKEGAKLVLENPELMREEIEKVIGWMEKTGIETWKRWTAFNFEPSAIFNEYLEHLKQKV
jgi:hypothetical protein